MNENGTRNGFGGWGVAMAFVGGALAGAGAALLLTPRSGPEARKRIRDAVHTSGDKVQRARVAAVEAAHAAREAFTEAMRDEH